MVVNSIDERVSVEVAVVEALLGVEVGLLVASFIDWSEDVLVAMSSIKVGVAVKYIVVVGKLVVVDVNVNVDIM